MAVKRIKPLIAWSDITKPDGSKIKAGEKVTKSDVGEDWDNLIEAGVLRIDLYPKTKTGESPRNARLRIINEDIKKLTDSYVAPRGKLTDDSDDESLAESLGEEGTGDDRTSS